MNWLIELRQRLHQSPELAFEEHQTAAILREELKRLARIYSTPEHIRAGATELIIHDFDSTGFLLEYSGGGDAYRLFRADMDALPITEATGCSFASQQPGVMHACGHDVHMTVLMGLIEKVLANQPRQNLLFLFQPAEEGKGGAQSVLAEGIIQQYPIEAVFALHVASGMPVGTISSRAGIIFGIPQEFDVRFQGKSAHVAFPEKGRDAIAAAAEFMQLMQADISELKKKERVIYHLGTIKGGSIRNVIAQSCLLEGTHRSLKPQVRDQMNDLTRKNAAQAAREIGCESEVEVLCSYDPVVNDARWVEALREVAAKLDVNYEEAATEMTGEDFGFFTTVYPGVLFWLGSGCQHSLHSPQFLPDEAAIEVGVKVMWELASRAPGNSGQGARKRA